MKGRQAHGASPHLSVDPVVTAAQVVLAFQTIRSRNLPPLEPSVVTVGTIHGGERFNIIPNEVRLEGTVRTYSTTIQDEAERRIREITAGVTAAAGARFEITYERGSPPVVNNVALTERMVPTLQRVLGAANVQRLEPAMVGEDFSYFANEVPGLFIRLGVQKPGTTSGDHQEKRREWHIQRNSWFRYVRQRDVRWQSVVSVDLPALLAQWHRAMR